MTQLIIAAKQRKLKEPKEGWSWMFDTDHSAVGAAAARAQLAPKETSELMLTGSTRSGEVRIK
jgi:hypothetical protein